MTYSISQISKILQAELTGILSVKELPVKQLLIDSRSLAEPHGVMFIALKTANNDGHRFIKELYEKGVRCFLVNKGFNEISPYQDAAFIQVPDTLKALQELAIWHRKQFDIPVLAITGSNGKTIVKEWLYQLISPDKNIVKSPLSYNSQVGVPLSVWQMDDSNEIGIFEAGISQPGEMEKLEKIISPTVGIFTNIGEAHASNFKDTQEKVEEKMKLFKHVKTLIYCRDYKNIDHALRYNSTYAGLRFFTWSLKTDADLKIINISQGAGSTSIEALFRGDKTSITIPFTDDASIENAMHCWAYLLFTGYENTVIAERMNNLQPVAMRMEMLKGMNNCTLINDSYNSDINSLTVALNFLHRQEQHIGKTIVLSDITQNGKDEKELYERIASIIKAKAPTRLIGIGEAISRNAGLFDIVSEPQTPKGALNSTIHSPPKADLGLSEKTFFSSTEDFLKHLHEFNFKDEAILLKGARSFEFEKISRILQEKAHETVMLINLAAIAHNLTYYRSLLKPSTKIMAMVKAFSYGSGSFEIANMLQFHRADYLAVAYPDEGVELRNAGISLPIMVMNPEPGSYDLFLKYRMEPEVYSFRTLKMAAEAIMHSGSNEKLPVHIKLDTGMHRLGFAEENLGELLAMLAQTPALTVKSIFSHLAASGSDKHKDFTLQQIEKFTKWSDKIMAALPYPIIRHILNSAGIARYPEAQFDMVRLGIGLYGVGNDAAEQRKLENAGILKSVISQVMHLKKGETVGYNQSGVLEKDSTIATVAIGYADGISREFGNGNGKMKVHGKLAPLVGDVCMDMCMLDITGIAAKEGDEVLIFDDAASLLQTAKDMNTIPYETLTSLSGRVKRVYIHE
jgi:Alr-MurF fusion protein